MKILSIKNTNINLSLTLLPLLVMIYFSGYIYEFIIIFFILLIHEISHLIIALINKVKVKEINIFHFGAMIKFEYNLGIDPIKEIIISLAGPMTNLILLILSYILIYIYPESQIIDFFIEINALLFTINILPILPLDGGRIIRGILYMQGGLKFSIKHINNISKISLTLLFFIGLFFTKDIFEVIVLVLLVVYLFKAARVEKEMAAYVLTQSITRKKILLKKNKIMKTHFLIALEGANLKSILNIILPHRYNIIFVINKNGDFLGRITEEKFFNGIIEYGSNGNIEMLLFNEKNTRKINTKDG
ncbi:hypothetical protein GOQ29_09575 [Clostridium sp. D2Q-14]|uniref:site-2 protease family protein n=1 Tax=Anaeromonas gelatinilytica TaxID=2683194 RepID=UPI00193B6735|nr:site-2 protease family protein [Anaeromonas gelatinilytica]MBS4535863.1 hypothetical protein [Anaeromonas gelatinilytica]